MRKKFKAITSKKKVSSPKIQLKKECILALHSLILYSILWLHYGVSFCLILTLGTTSYSEPSVASTKCKLHQRS